MDKNSRREQSTGDLRMEIARSRDRLTSDLRDFRRDIDIPRRIKRSFQTQTGAWITAAVVVGALLIVLPARKKLIRVEAKGPRRGKKTKEGILQAGFALGALRFAATLLKPMVVQFVSRKMRGYMSDGYAPKPKSRAMI